ncbi:MAG: amidohydrolase, partial [Aigarchaeota archaeon]|nr:amidohydrolase [Aigarchaeota archaeon]
DLAAVAYLLKDKSVVERIREKLGMDRVLFGSDYPAVLGADIKTMVKTVEESPYLTDIEKEQVLYSNAARQLEL